MGRRIAAPLCFIIHFHTQIAAFCDTEKIGSDCNYFWKQISGLSCFFVYLAKVVHRSLYFWKHISVLWMTREQSMCYMIGTWFCVQDDGILPSVICVRPKGKFSCCCLMIWKFHGIEITSDRWCVFFQYRFSLPLLCKPIGRSLRIAVSSIIAEQKSGIQNSSKWTTDVSITAGPANHLPTQQVTCAGSDPAH